MVTLIARLNVNSVHWVGTSMGGLIGMLIASVPEEPDPPAGAQRCGAGGDRRVGWQRIATYVGADPTWASFDEALAYVKLISAPFGPLTEAQWRHTSTETSILQRPDGRWAFRYDTADQQNLSRQHSPTRISTCGGSAAIASRRWSCAVPSGFADPRYLAEDGRMRAASEAG